VPHVLIEVRREAGEELEHAMVEAVHGALVEAFRIPEKDRHVRLLVHPAHRFATPPDLEQPELATIVTIDCFAGRTVAAKRRLYAEVVERLESVGVPRSHVSILLRESALENWGIRGGVPASDVDLGFSVEV